MSGTDQAATIETSFQGLRTIAVVGASANPARPSHGVMRYLLRAGYDCIPVNPGHAGGMILDRPCFASLADVPTPIDMVDVFRRTDAIPGVVEEVLALDPLPRVLWLQLGIRHEAAAERARRAGMIVVQDRCTKIEHARLTR